MLLESRRPIQTLPLRAGFGVRPVSVLGQPLWNPPGGGGVPFQAGPAPGGGGAPTPGLDCYQCGQGFQQMTADIAATIPGCIKVDASLCSAAASSAPAPMITPGISAPGMPVVGACAPLTPGNCAQPLALNVTAFRADTMKGAAGAKVQVALITYDHVTGNIIGTPQLVETGETDAEGKYFVSLSVPEPSQWFGYRVSISTGSSFSFVPKTEDVQGFQPNNSQKVSVTFAVCPSGVDDLICEVGERQVMFTKVFSQQMEAWGPGAGTQTNFAFRMGHNYVYQMHPRNSLLAKYWETLSYAVCDLGIPPSDWPALLANYDQVQKIFDAIPWPSDGKTKTLFVNCARGLPIFNGQAVADPRLYAPTFSTYFPREDYKIRGDMGGSYLLNIHMIFQCMVEELQKEAAALRKALASLSLFRFIAALILAPLTGGAMLTTLIAETGQLVLAHYQQNAIVSDVNGVIAGVAKNVGAGAAGIGAGLFAAGAALLIPLLVQGADPTVQKIAELFGPRVAEAAARDLLNNVVGDGTVAGEGLLSVAGLGTAGATLAVEAMLSLISLKGVEKAKAFIAEVSGVKDFISRCATPDASGHMCADIMPFVLWCIEAMMLDKFFDHVAEIAGIKDVNVNADVIKPTATMIEAQGIPVPSSATTPGGAPSSVAGGLAAAAGIGAGGFLALLLTGAFATK